MTAERTKPHFAQDEPPQPPPIYYDEPGTVSTASVVAAGIAFIVGGSIVLCSGIGFAAFVSDYRNPSDFPGLMSGTCSFFLLLPAGVSLFLVLIEYRRRLFLIWMGIAVFAAISLFLLSGIAHG